jgi:hypothetical protein
MDVMDFDLDEEEDLSTVLGTRSLAARDMVPEGFDNTLRARGVLELTQLGRWYTTRPYTGRPGQAGRELRPIGITGPIRQHSRFPWQSVQGYALERMYPYFIHECLFFPFVLHKRQVFCKYTEALEGVVEFRTFAVILRSVAAPASPRSIGECSYPEIFLIQNLH